jgi:hypothetical protein
MKLIKTHRIWSSRIAKNLVKYGFAADEKQTYQAMLELIKNTEEVSLLRLRELSADLASNSTSKRREKTALLLLSRMKLKPAKSAKKSDAKAAAQIAKKPTTKVIDIASKRTTKSQILKELERLHKLLAQ